MNTPRIFLLSAVLFLAARVDALAQQEPPVAPGDRVRVLALGSREPSLCTVLALKPDTVVLKPEGSAAPLVLALADVRELQVSRGQRSNAGKGALVGGLVGSGLGMSLGFLSWGRGATPEVKDAVAAGALFGGIGMLVGAAIGATSSSEQWEEIPLDRLRVSLMPQRRPALALSVSMRL